MRRVPPVANPSAKFSGVHQANLLETTQPPGERLRLRNQLFTERFAAVPKRNRDSLHERYTTPIFATVNAMHCGRSRSRVVVLNATASSLNALTVDRKSTRLNSSHRCISYA